ncbi:hypothetical protein C8R48DRAFT_204199 [Suillus tomentosus]|nr:hypothetical protein C8R48DRAFT_204199 [Suillus tomentosus]
MTDTTTRSTSIERRNLIGERPLRRIAWQCACMMGWFRDVMVMFSYLNLIITIEVRTGSNRMRVTILGIFSHTSLSTSTYSNSKSRLLESTTIVWHYRLLFEYLRVTFQAPIFQNFLHLDAVRQGQHRGTAHPLSYSRRHTRRSRMDISQVRLPVLTHIRFNTRFISHRSFQVSESTPDARLSVVLRVIRIFKSKELESSCTSQYLNATSV